MSTPTTSYNYYIAPSNFIKEEREDVEDIIKRAIKKTTNKDIENPNTLNQFTLHDDSCSGYPGFQDKINGYLSNEDTNALIIGAITGELIVGIIILTFGYDDSDKLDAINIIQICGKGFGKPLIDITKSIGKLLSIKKIISNPIEDSIAFHKKHRFVVENQGDGSYLATLSLSTKKKRGGGGSKKIKKKNNKSKRETYKPILIYNKSHG
jgi:hypothetical protein